MAYYDCSRKAGNDRQLMHQLLMARKLFFTMKICEIPMQFYYLDYEPLKADRGRAAVIGVVSPIIYLLKHFGALVE